MFQQLSVWIPLGLCTFLVIVVMVTRSVGCILPSMAVDKEGRVCCCCCGTTEADIFVGNTWKMCLRCMLATMPSLKKMTS